jgi:hypothetical protein
VVDKCESGLTLQWSRTHQRPLVPRSLWWVRLTASVGRQLMLPLTLSGIVMIGRPSSGDDSLEDALTSILARLEREKPSRLLRLGNRVDFNGGLIRLVSSWNQLVAISHGEIRVEREARGISIRYELWFTQLLIVVTLGVGAIFGLLIMAAPNLSIAGKFVFLSAAWICLAGGNIAITAFRFPRFLRRAVEPNGTRHA